MHFDMNCDMGEGIGNDEKIMPFITSANIACGYHAGDEQTMRSTILLAKKYNVHAGAHPSFDDRENFGRRELNLSLNEIYQLVYKQLQLFTTIADDCKVLVHHVKPHGALYNMAARDEQLAGAIATAVKDFNSHLVVYGLSNSYLIHASKNAGLQTKAEVFADRTYQDDGSLTPRSMPNALIENEERAVQQVLQMIEQKTVTSTSGNEVRIEAETICIHGDGRHAVQFAQQIHQALYKFNA